MIPENTKQSRKNWMLFNTLALLIIFAASSFASLGPYQWWHFKQFWYPVLGAALMTCYICFGLKNNRLEEKVLVAFCVWLVISRVLNGDWFLATDGTVVFDIALSCMFLTVCIILPDAKRRKALDAFAVVSILLYTFGAVLGIYTAITGNIIPNPLYESDLSSMSNLRLYIFDNNPNASGCWMFICIFFIIYLFFRYKNPVIRTVLVLFGLTDYTALALTASRSCMLGCAVCMAMLVAVLAFKYLKVKKTGYKVLTLAVALCVAGPLCYSGFSGARHLAGKAAVDYMESKQSEEVYAEESSVRPAYSAENLSSYVQLSSETDESDSSQDDDIFKDERGFEDSGRLPIYKAGIISLKDEPARLFRGCLYDDVMKTSWPYLTKEYAHMHNSYLEVLHLVGLPGLLLVIAFTVLLVIRAVRLLFSESEKADMAVKSLVLFLPGYFIYNMLETSMFIYQDFRSISLFLIAGAVIAYSHEICPPLVTIVRKKRK